MEIRWKCGEVGGRKVKVTGHVGVFRTMERERRGWGRRDDGRNYHYHHHDEADTTDSLSKFFCNEGQFPVGSGEYKDVAATMNKVPLAMTEHLPGLIRTLF